MAPNVVHVLCPISHFWTRLIFYRNVCRDEDRSLERFLTSDGTLDDATDYKMIGIYVVLYYQCRCA